MEIKNSINGSQSFGMAFSHTHLDCRKYLSSTFVHKPHKLEKALKLLDSKCDAHKHFDMFHSSHDNSIKIIGKTDMAGKKLAEKYGSSILSLSKSVKHPNSVQKLEMNLDELEKSPEGPKDILEKVFFKLYRCICLKYAEIKLKRSPYEMLPANVRKGVDIINGLEADM